MYYLLDDEVSIGHLRGQVCTDSTGFYYISGHFFSLQHHFPAMYELASRMSVGEGNFPYLESIEDINKFIKISKGIMESKDYYLDYRDYLDRKELGLIQ